jgi:hypothetical protein
MFVFMLGVPQLPEANSPAPLYRKLSNLRAPVWWIIVQQKMIVVEWLSWLHGYMVLYPVLMLFPSLSHHFPIIFPWNSRYKLHPTGWLRVTEVSQNSAAGAYNVVVARRQLLHNSSRLVHVISAISIYIYTLYTLIYIYWLTYIEIYWYMNSY